MAAAAVSLATVVWRHRVTRVCVVTVVQTYLQHSKILQSIGYYRALKEDYYLWFFSFYEISFFKPVMRVFKMQYCTHLYNLNIVKKNSRENTDDVLDPICVV